MSRQPANWSGLVGDDAHRPAVDPAEADEDVARVAGLDLQELVVVEDPRSPVHVIGLVGESGISVSSSRSLGEVVLDRARCGGAGSAAARRSCWAAGS